jgi:DnaJ homolog subfamily B member 4
MQVVNRHHRSSNRSAFSFLSSPRITSCSSFQISEAFEVLSDKQKRTIYDQFGEDGLKHGGPSPGAGAGPSPFSGFSGFPGGGGTTYSFTSSGSPGGFAPTDPMKIFE